MSVRWISSIRRKFFLCLFLSFIHSFILRLLFILPIYRTDTPDTTQISMVQIPVEVAHTVDENTSQEHKGGPSWIRGQQNIRATARDQGACRAWNAREAVLPLIYQIIIRNLIQQLNYWFCYQAEVKRFSLQVNLGDFYQYTYSYIKICIIASLI